MTTSICGFKGQYRFLSNFFVEPDGTHTEAEFQARKAKDPAQAAAILQMSPGDSKKAASRRGLRLPDGSLFKIELIDDWDDIRNDVMLEVLRKKFTDHEVLRQQLLDTGDAYLEETNHWGDRYWGVDGTGENWLGKLLMQVRQELSGGQ